MIVWYSGHIMMVSEIKEPSGKNGMYKMEDVSILESVYNNGNTVYGAVKSRFIEDLKYWNNDIGDYQYRNWEIWRQK